MTDDRESNECLCSSIAGGLGKEREERERERECTREEAQIERRGGYIVEIWLATMERLLCAREIFKSTSRAKRVRRVEQVFREPENL